MIYGYVLISTADGKHKIDQEIRHLVRLGAETDNIYAEFSDGSAKFGQKLIKILGMIKEGDSLLSTSPGRIAKNPLQMHELIKLIRRVKARLIFGSFVLDFSDIPDQRTEGMLVMADIFKDLEIEIRKSEEFNNSSSTARARKRGVGRPPLSVESIPGIFHRYYPKLLSKEINITELSRLCNISRTMIYRYIDVVESAG
jgi:hypothetical protein